MTRDPGKKSKKKGEGEERRKKKMGNKEEEEERWERRVRMNTREKMIKINIKIKI